MNRRIFTIFEHTKINIVESRLVINCLYHYIGLHIGNETRVAGKPGNSAVFKALNWGLCAVKKNKFDWFDLNLKCGTNIKKLRYNNKYTNNNNN